MPSTTFQTFKELNPQSNSMCLTRSDVSVFRCGCRAQRGGQSTGTWPARSSYPPCMRALETFAMFSAVCMLPPSTNLGFWAQLDNLIEQIEQQPVSRPLEDEALFDDWQVTYVSTAKAPRQEGQRESRTMIADWLSHYIVHRFLLLHSIQCMLHTPPRQPPEVRSMHLVRLFSLVRAVTTVQARRLLVCSGGWKVQRAYWAAPVQID